MKTKQILICLFVVLLYACSTKNDGAPDSNPDDILLLRKWYYVSQTSSGKKVYYKACGNGNRDYIEFVAPNVYSEYHWKSTNDCSYVIESFMKWNKKGDVINFTYNGNTVYTALISELTATTFKFVYTDSMTKSSILYECQSY